MIGYFTVYDGGNKAAPKERSRVATLFHSECTVVRDRVEAPYRVYHVIYRNWYICQS